MIQTPRTPMTTKRRKKCAYEKALRDVPMIAPPAARARRRQPERAVQKAVKELFERVGGAVWTLGTVRRKGDHPGTMQTPGLPDLWVTLPPTRQSSRLALWFECKRKGGRLSIPQEVFRMECQRVGVNHLVGGVDDAIAFLREGGWLK